MNRRWGLVSGAVIVVGVATGLIVAQEKSASDAGKGAQRKPDETAIRETSQAFGRAFEKGDAKAVAGFWTETGEYLDEGGEPLRGRAAIEKAYADFFGKRQEVKVEGTSDSIRFLGQDAAIEEGTFTVRSKGAGTTSSRYSALFVREKGRWLMATLKEWGDDTTNRANLQDLAWLIGTWESEGAEQKVRTSYEWADNKTFIHGRYSITGKKDNKMAGSGTQVIGVDRAANAVRAWTFDVDGGFGQSMWAWDGDRWGIDSGGTLADGSRTSAVNIMTPSGNDAFSWRSVERTLNGQNLPDIAAVKVKRVSGGK